MRVLSFGRPQLLGHVGLLASLVGACAGVSAEELCLNAPPDSPSGMSCEVGKPAYANRWMGFSTDDEPCESDPVGGEWMCQSSEYDGGPFGYWWTISASSTDPYVTTATPDDVIDRLYLWLTCVSVGTSPNSVAGLKSVTLNVAGTLTVVGFTPLSGFVNLGTPTQLELVSGGCALQPTLVGAFDIQVPTPVFFASWGRVKSTYQSEY